MIEFRNLSKHFDKVKAIDNISATIEEGHVFGLIGTNGAGKSTSMRSYEAGSGNDQCGRGTGV